MSYNGGEEIAKVLLDNGADPNIGGGIWGSPLHIASVDDAEKVVSLLLDYGADINPRADIRPWRNALYIASDRGYENVIKMLLDRESNVNAVSSEITAGRSSKRL